MIRCLLAHLWPSVPYGLEQPISPIVTGLNSFLNKTLLDFARLLRQKPWRFNIFYHDVFPCAHFLFISFHSRSDACAVQHSLVYHELFKRSHWQLSVFVAVQLGHDVVYMTWLELNFVLRVWLCARDEVFNVFVSEIVLSWLELENAGRMGTVLALVVLRFLQDFSSLIENLFFVTHDVHS